MIGRALTTLLCGGLLAGCGLLNAGVFGPVDGSGAGDDCGLEDCFCSGPECVCDDVNQICECLGDCSVEADSGPSCDGACSCAPDGCACHDDNCEARVNDERCSGSSCICTTAGCSTG